MSKSEEVKPDDGKIEKDSDQLENPSSQNSLAASPPVVAVAATADRERSKHEQVPKTHCARWEMEELMAGP